MLKVILIFYIKYVNWWFKICTFVDIVYITGATLVAFLIAIIIMCTIYWNQNHCFLAVDD